MLEYVDNINNIKISTVPVWLESGASLGETLHHDVPARFRAQYHHWGWHKWIETRHFSLSMWADWHITAVWLQCKCILQCRYRIL